MEGYCNSADDALLEVCRNATLPSPETSFQIPMLVFCVVSIIIGVAGNSLVLTALCLVPRLRTFSNIFIGNLAVADLGALSAGITTVLLGLCGDNNEILQDNPWICLALLHFTFHFIATSVITLQIIAVDRFLIITKLRPVYNLYYKGWRIWALVGGTWTIGLIVAAFSLSPSFVCRDAYMEPLHACWIDTYNTVSVWFLTVGMSVSCFLCLFTIPFFFALTFRKIWAARRGLSRFSAQSPTSGGNGTRPTGITFSKEELAVTKMMAIVYFTYVICWAPILLDHLSYFGGRCAGYTTHYACSLLALVNSSLNPLIYAGVNRSFRRSFLKVLRQNPQSEATETSMSMNVT